MKMNLSNRAHRLGGAAAVALTASLLLIGVLQTPAGAVVGPPYNTSTTIHHSVAFPVTGQSETFTAQVKAMHVGAPVPTGQVTFTITVAPIAPRSTVTDRIRPPSVGIATCAVSAGLLHAGSSYTVTAVYAATPGDLGSTAVPLVQPVSAGVTMTSVASSTNPTVTGQPVTFTASVAVSGSATGPMTGTVTFSNSVTCDSGNVVAFSGPQVQCVVSGGLLHSGSVYVVSATYSGDQNFSGSSGHVNQMVNSDATTVALGVNPNVCNGDICTAPQGTPVTFTASATANAPGAGIPTGSIAFTIIPAGSKTSFTCDSGNTVALDNTGQASCSFDGGVPASVYYTVTATLVGDPNFLTASATLYENTTMTATNTTVVPDKHVVAGQTFNVTATVTPVASSAYVPGGQVEISVCGANSNGGNGCQGGPVDVQPNGTAVFTVGGGEFPGTYSVYAIYLGDQNFQGSTALRRSVIVARSPTTLTVTSSENASLDGDQVTLTATVEGANGSSGSTLLGPPSGVLSFTITGPSGSITCQGGNVIPLNSGPTDEGVAQCFLPAGTLTDPAAPASTSYAVTVTYGSDGNYGSSTGKLTQVVVPPVS